MVYLAEFVFLGFFTLNPIVNVLVARNDISGGVPPSLLRRSSWTALISSFFLAIFYWLTWRPVFFLVHTGEMPDLAPSNVVMMSVGFLALFEALSVLTWAMWACSPTLLLGYTYLRVSKGQSWCVDKVCKEANDWNNNPWSRRIVYGVLIAVHSCVVISALAFLIQLATFDWT